jgi:hypothetical protein
MRDEGKPGSERVDVRVQTKQFALRVIRLFSALPRGPVADVIGKQLLRSGTSAPLLDECNQLTAILSTIAKKVKAQGN